MRNIDADSLMQRVVEIQASDKRPEASVGEIIIAISEAPTVDAVPVVHGRWARMDAHKGIEQFKCSVCRSECYVPTCIGEPMYGYCPNCGARMDGGSIDGK